MVARIEDHRVREHRAEQHRGGGTARLESVLTEALDHQGGRGADRIEGGGDRDASLDRADVVMVQDLDDLGLLDPGDALGLLGVVDEQHAPTGRGDQIRAGEQPDGVPPGIDDDRRAVVDLLDLLRYVGDEVLVA